MKHLYTRYQWLGGWWRWHYGQCGKCIQSVQQAANEDNGAEHNSDLANTTKLPPGTEQGIPHTFYTELLSFKATHHRKSELRPKTNHNNLSHPIHSFYSNIEIMCVRVCLRNRNPCVRLYLTLSLIGRSDCQKEIVANGRAHYKINLQLLLADNLFQLKWRHIRKFGIMEGILKDKGQLQHQFKVKD